jgi:mRNA interferase YafQ
MRQISYSNQFKKDFKRVQKQGLNLSKLKTVIETLEANLPLDNSLKDHALRGNYAGTRECHVEPDWLLIYRIEGNELHIIRTGSHSELFKK